MKIFLIDDDKVISLALTKKLSEYGYTIDSFDSFNNFINNNINEVCDLYIIDIGLPGEDGFKIIHHLRNSLSLETPIIVVSGYNRVDYKVRALNIGADDYITKPFSTEELIARIQTITKRKIVKTPEKIIKYRDISIHPRSGEIRKNSELIKLTKKEKLLFHFFISNMEKLIKKEELSSSIWLKNGEDEKMTNTIGVTLFNLRKKLQGSFYLETFPGEGYILRK